MSSRGDRLAAKLKKIREAEREKKIQKTEKNEATQVERRLAQTDKMYLATKVLGYDFQEDVHAELFAQLIPMDASKAFFLNSDIKNRMILWPRGHFKSTAVVVEIIQHILNFPDIRILIMQGTLKTTKRLLREIMSHFTGDARSSRLPELFPEFCGNKKQLQGSAEAFTVPARQRQQLQQATVTCASPKSTKTGQHYDEGFFDDLVNDQNYRSVELLAKVQEDFDMCDPLIDPGGYRTVTGTRYAFGDLYEVIAARALSTPGKWIISIKTCWSDDGKEVRFPKRGLADGRIIGLTREELLQKQKDDPGMFAGQYLNQPVASSEALFSEELMLSAVIANDQTPALSSPVIFVDLASSGGPVSDDSVIIVGKADALGRLYVCDVFGGQWSPYQLAPMLIAAALKHRPLRIMIENTSSSKYFVAYLMTVCRDKGVVLPVDFLKVDNSKDAKKTRIAALEGLIKNKKLFFLAGLPQVAWEKTMEQFTQWPKAKYGHDDYPDTIALMAREMGQAALGLPTATRKHPLLAAMEQQGTSFAQSFVTPARRDPFGGCGDDFAF